MEKEEYLAMYTVEGDHWWYDGLRMLVLAFVEDFARANPDPLILDAGCGTGGMLAALKNYRAFGLDYSEEAMKFCRLRGLGNITQGSISNIPFEDGRFQIVISLDVLYHMGVSDDLLALREFYRVAERNGMVILNLPAYDFLKSAHDKMNWARHRYTLKEVRAKVETAGFSIERITYRNAVLFPAAAAARIAGNLFGGRREEKKSDLRPVPAALNAMLKGILSSENALIRRGVNFPFGLSIFCVARKR